MICKALVIAQIFFFGCLYSQMKNVNDVSISDVRFFLYSGNKGFTTAGAYTHFDDMSKSGIKTSQLEDNDLIKFQSILNKAERKKHWQTKVGMHVTFCEIKFKRIDTLCRVIIRTGKEKIIITDLTQNVDYIITDSDNINWMLAIVDGFNIKCQPINN